MVTHVLGVVAALSCSSSSSMRAGLPRGSWHQTPCLEWSSEKVGWGLGQKTHQFFGSQVSPREGPCLKALLGAGPGWSCIALRPPCQSFPSCWIQGLGVAPRWNRSLVGVLVFTARHRCSWHFRNMTHFTLEFRNRNVFGADEEAEHSSCSSLFVLFRCMCSGLL